MIKKMQLLTLAECKKQYKAAKAAYYNGVKPLMTDAAFDKLEDHIRKNEPTWAELHKTGVKVGKKVEVALAHPMPSLNKAYPAEFPKWVAKNPARRYVVMEKLDGSSVQLTYNGAGKPVSLVTRGDGVNGKDISFLIPHLNLPARPMKGLSRDQTVFRCEAVMAKSVFEKKWASKFENSRNLVNGLLNRTDAHAALKDVDFVVLGCYGQTLPTGLDRAQRFGLKAVKFVLLKAELIEAELLASMRVSGRYDMDGLVIAPEDFELVYKNQDKPKGIVAYKVNDEENAAVVTVKQIIWQVTGRGRIVPKIEIEPTRMDGVMVKHAAAHNAQWMMDRKIGPGAQVKVLRSGGVIPKIVDVVKAGKLQEPTIPYKKEGVHFVVANASGATSAKIDVMNIVKFMKTLGIELVAGKTASALFQSGLRTPMDYIKAYANKKLGLMISDAGFDGKQGVKIYDEIKRVFDNPISMKKLMVASQIFGVGIGERKLTQIEDAGISMDQLHNYKGFPTKVLLEVPGFSEKTVQVLKDGWYTWLEFYHQCDTKLILEGHPPKKKKVVVGKLSGQRVSFTGFRDADLEAKIEAAGGEVVTFGSKTTLLVYKADGKASTKVVKAEEKGVKTVELSKFKL